jgi:membrane protease YdiL (CAAX protease family)
VRLGAVLVLLAAHNLLANRWADGRGYVPVNLATAGVVVALAGPGRRGLAVGSPAVGVAAALAVLVAMGVVAARPRTRRLLADRRMAGVDARGTAWRALVRIPLGTVVLEEVAFRGVLPALVSPAGAAGLFGLWHIVPAAKTFDVNGFALSPRSRAWVLAGAVAGTAAAGLALWALRVAGGGLLAPALVHAAANSGATVAAYAVLRPGSGEQSLIR